MNIYMSILAGVALVALAPENASALTFVQVVGLFHIVIGLLLTATLLVFAIGITLYVSRINTWPSHRDEAIRVLEWGVVMLFVLILLIALVNFFQRHSGIALPVLAFGIMLVVGFFVLRAIGQGKKEPKKSKPGGGHGGAPKH